jgi:hypothetical protein
LVVPISTFHPNIFEKIEVVLSMKGVVRSSAVAAGVRIIVSDILRASSL